ncbi:MAG: GNAT family N-acetyltransferase [Clostridia bacterium]|nr:GNAT family N-acetyltransferase [Clostridia bacterium]
MNNRDILRIAMEQSAVDMNCNAEDFQKDKNVIVVSRENVSARKYLKLPFACNLVSYGSNVVASVSPAYCEVVSNYIQSYAMEHLMETPHLHVLEQELSVYGLSICYMAEFFLPDLDRLHPQPCHYELKLLLPSDFALLYAPQWSNALYEKRKHLDVLAIGAYDGDRLVGLAGCSADCETMWQIGVDVLPEYRRQGIAAALTSRLALEILDRGKVPFYCCAWCNVKSARNAIRSGFSPAWVEMTVKPKDFVDEMNIVQ